MAHLHAVNLPLLFARRYPVVFVLKMADVRMTHSTGTGLVVKAWK